MKNIIYIVVFSLFSACTTKFNTIDTGLANGNFTGNMYEYFKKSSYNWDSTRLMIERGKLVDLFNGERPGYENFTFFGPTNHSIRRYMKTNNIGSIKEMSEDFCRETILRHIVKKRYMRNDIPKGTPAVYKEDEPYKIQGDGGKVLEGEAGNRFWIYSFQGSYAGVPDIGAIELKIVSLESAAKIEIASSNIETTNGVVHSLQYNYTLCEL